MARTPRPTGPRRRRRWPFVLALGLGSLALVHSCLFHGANGSILTVAGGWFADTAIPDRQASAWGTVAVRPFSVAVGKEPVARLRPDYLSFSVDIAQLVGAPWWGAGDGQAPARPVPWADPRLNALARGLAPAMLRIGGTDADRVYFDAAGAQSKPSAFAYRLDPAEWDRVGDFARRNGLELSYTLNAGSGPRTGRRWSPEQALAIIRYSQERRIPVALWELGNEMNAFWLQHGLGSQVSPAEYAKELRQLRQAADRLPQPVALANQGSAFWPILGEATVDFTAESLRLAGDALDAVNWHYYPQQSRRAAVAVRRAAPGRLLDPANLDEAAHWADRMAALRDRHAPGRLLMLGESGNAQCGGEPGVSDSWLSGLWWLDQLGLLAGHGVGRVVHQTLIGGDYGMIDAASLEPRPDYWASLLFKRLVGPERYAAAVGTPDGGQPTLRAYAFSAKGGGGRCLLLINLDRRANAWLSLGGLTGKAKLQAWFLTAPDVQGGELWLNGKRLAAQPDGTPPDTPPVDSPPSFLLHPLSACFVVY